jgi:hypothetical protein
VVLVGPSVTLVVGAVVDVDVEVAVVVLALGFVVVVAFLVVVVRAVLAVVEEPSTPTPDRNEVEVELDEEEDVVDDPDVTRAGELPPPPKRACRPRTMPTTSTSAARPTTIRRRVYTDMRER